MVSCAGAAAAFVTYVNQLTEKYRHLCAELLLSEIISAQSGSLERNMLRFKESADDRGIANAILTDDKSGGMFQINLMTKPNHGLYDVTIFWQRISESDKIEYHTTSESASRIDRYGSQPDCISQKFPYLRPFCYCV